MNFLRWLTLWTAMIALLLSIIACIAIRQQMNRIDEVETAMYANVDEAMTSVADSFKLNRLDYSLEWRTRDGAKAQVGVFSE